MTYKDRENEIIQSGIGQLDIVYSKLSFKLSWTHYQILMRIEDKDERDFYEKEAIRSGWQMRVRYRKNQRTFYICHISLNLPDWRIRHLTMKVIWNRQSLIKCRNFCWN